MNRPSFLKYSNLLSQNLCFQKSGRGPPFSKTGCLRDETDCVHELTATLWLHNKEERAIKAHRPPLESSLKLSDVDECFLAGNLI